MAHPVDVQIGLRIREERVSAGLTQKELSSIIGVKFQQLQKYETAANRVSGSRLWMIAKALAVPVSTFLPDDDETSESAIEREPANARLMRDILRLEPEIRREVVRFVQAISGDQDQTEND
ncbi:MAG: helix-turn-helix transcriptional regulator [Maritimibacter sp.]|nr:helix-turn-helix transcriptional regulator [Maritimibacter sp.]